MSDEKRDYPAWLDEELFRGLTGEETPAAPQDAPAPAAAAPQTDAAPETEKTPKKKKKTGTAAPAEEKNAAKKPKKEKSGEAKSGKKKAAPKSAGDGDKSPSGGGKKTPSENGGENKKDKKAAAAERGKTEKKSKGRKAARGFLITLLVLVSLALLLCVGATVCAYLVTNSDTNLPNVYLGGVYVGGMTKEQSIAALDEAKWDETRGGTLKVKLPEGVDFELDYLTAGAYEPKEEAVEAAIAYGHTADMFANLYTYARGMMESVDLCRTEFTIDRGYVSAAVDKAVDEFETVTAGEAYTVNEEKSLIEFLKGAGDLTLDRKAICDKACELLLTGGHELEWTEIEGEPQMPDFAAIEAMLSSEPANASYDPSKDEIIPEVKGVEFDAKAAEEQWKKAAVMEKFSVPITFIEPEITAESLKEVLFRDKLGSCETWLWGSTANRISNVRLACSRFNGKVLTPGERFSYNDIVGERTSDAGFKLAPTYNGTAHVDGLGGGICQVSSTLYNAVQYANLEVNERTCHTMLVGYLPAGLDATVDWPDTNFVFTNNSDYPVKIKASVDDSGRKLTVEIWGTNPDGFHVEIMRGEWPAYDDEYQEKYDLNVLVGYGAWNYRRVYDADGNYTDGPKVYSYYHIPEEEIKWPAVPKDEPDDYEEPAPPDPGGSGETGGETGGGDSGGDGGEVITIGGDGGETGDTGGGDSGGDTGGGDSGGDGGETGGEG